MAISEFQPSDTEPQQEPIEAPALEDVMFAIFEYARRSDGIDSTEGHARVRQRERMFSKDREIRAMLHAMQTQAYADGRRDEREALPFERSNEREVREACSVLRTVMGNPVISGRGEQTLHGQTIRIAAEFIGAVTSLLPSSYYMDPPDGGSVTVLEQFQRMAQDARMWREQQERIARAIECELRCEG